MYCAGSYTHNSKIVIHGSNCTCDMTTMTITILIPRKSSIIVVFVGSKEAGINDASYLPIGTSRRSQIHNPITIGIPNITCSDHVDAIRHCLRG